MRSQTSKLMQRTHQPVRRWVKQGSHYDNIWYS